jgi:hypothetical protein
MDGLGAQLAIEWFVSCVYDRVEDRFGRVAALLVSLLVAITLLGVIVGAAWYFLLA